MYARMKNVSNTTSVKITVQMVLIIIFENSIPIKYVWDFNSILNRRSPDKFPALLDRIYSTLCMGAFLSENQ